MIAQCDCLEEEQCREMSTGFSGEHCVGEKFLLWSNKCVRIRSRLNVGGAGS